MSVVKLSDHRLATTVVDVAEQKSGRLLLKDAERAIGRDLRAVGKVLNTDWPAAERICERLCEYITDVPEHDGVKLITSIVHHAYSTYYARREEPDRRRFQTFVEALLGRTALLLSQTVITAHSRPSCEWEAVTGTSLRQWLDTFHVQRCVVGRRLDKGDSQMVVSIYGALCRSILSDEEARLMRGG